MSSFFTALGIERLSAADRLLFICEIWDSLPKPPPPRLMDEQHRGLERRLALMDADTMAWRPSREAEARVRRRLDG